MMNYELFISKEKFNNNSFKWNNYINFLIKNIHIALEKAVFMMRGFMQEWWILNRQ